MHVRRGKLEQGEERMERVTAMEEFVFEAAAYIKKVWEVVVGESVCKRT